MQSQILGVGNSWYLKERLPIQKMRTDTLLFYCHVGVPTLLMARSNYSTWHFLFASYLLKIWKKNGK
jgi:hypothetical protein